MATAKSPGRKLRPTNYHNIGVQGRVTGVQLPRRPVDEHGLERMEGIFSPTPGKPPIRNPPRFSNGTSQSSEPMEIVESSAPEPTTVLADRVQQSASRPSIPHSRSPSKRTTLGPPKRGSSVSALSPVRPQSSARNKSQSPFRARKLDFSIAEGRQSPYSLPNGHTNGASSRAPPRDVFDLPRSSPEKGATPPPIRFGEEDDMSFPNAMQDDEEDGYNAHHNQSEIEHDASQQLADEEAAAVAATAKSMSGKRRPGRPPREALSPDTHVANESLVETEVQEDEAAPEPEQDPELEEPLKKKRGRPAKINKTAALKPKDKNQGAKALHLQAAPKAYEDLQTMHQRQRTRLETPGEDDGVSHTRSGRNVFAPLQFWKGERVIYEHDVRYPAVREIIRVDDATPVKRHVRQGGGTRTKKRKRNNVFEDDIEDDQQEPWETANGYIRAPVQLWDAELGVSVQNEEEEQLIAHSSARIQPRASPDNPSFLFTKPLTTPFFGSGMIELPPMGSKGTKNSRKFQFMFYVVSGKVAVDVAGTRFVISKGGMWQVPRGNFYSITNENDTHSARIFFAQGCEPLVEPREPPNPADLKQ